MASPKLEEKSFYFVLSLVYMVGNPDLSNPWKVQNVMGLNLKFKAELWFDQGFDSNNSKAKWKHN